MKNSITEGDFHLLNPGVNPDCTNLIIGSSYCVRPVGSITSYISGTAIPTSLTNFWNLPSATITWVDATATPLPLANGTRTDCTDYEISQGNFTASSTLEPCYSFAKAHWAPYEEFLGWNPDAQTQVDTTGECFIQPGFRYCTALALPHDCKRIPDTLLHKADSVY